MSRNYELNRHKKSDKIKWVVTAIVALLLAAGVATTLAMGVTNNGWFAKDDTKIEQPADKTEEEIPDNGANSALETVED